MTSPGSEIAEALVGESAHAAPAKIVDGLSDELAHRRVSGAPHTIYEELWHLAFWQQIMLDWMSGIETPYPASVDDPFPTEAQTAGESWDELRERFLSGASEAASIASDSSRLTKPLQRPFRPGQPARPMNLQDELISLAAHNAYHLGRIVLLRQVLGSWPPPSGGYTW